MPPLPQLHNLLLPVDVMLSRHDAILESRHLSWPDEAACAVWAQGLAIHPGLRNAYIELHGGLGAGKTTFTRHLLRALGVQGRITSPTYAVVETYNSPVMPVAHFDFYRFEDPREWADAGFRDLFAAPGLKIAEWPEKATGVLPTPDLSLTLEVLADDSRSVLAQAFTPVGVELLQ
jgi:tRNA threonylcarbamoyladenosine biosynthesis protein TsaE